MNWTTEWPTVEGWYWQYEPEHDRNHNQPANKYSGRRPEPNFAPATLTPVQFQKNMDGDLWLFGRGIVYGPHQLKRPALFLGPIALPPLPISEGDERQDDGRPASYDQLVAIAAKLFGPEALIGEESTGSGDEELVICTGLMEGEGGELLPISNPKDRTVVDHTPLP